MKKEFFIATTNSQSTIHKSTDGGVTWSNIGDPINAGDLRSIAVTPRETIVALVGNELYTNDTTFVTTGIIGKNEKRPLSFLLNQNYPNPFNPSTTINYRIAKAGKIVLKIYDLLGKEVNTLVDENKPSGSYSVAFNASNLPSGIYIYALRSDGFASNNKMILLK